MSGGDHLEHIERLKGSDFNLTRKEVVKKIDDKTDTFYVIGADNTKAYCMTAHDKGTEYVKTRPDYSKEDNLLKLPIF